MVTPEPAERTSEEPLPLDTWAALLGEWYDRRAERIEISPGLLADLRRDLQRAQMRVDELAGIDRARAEVEQGPAVVRALLDLGWTPPRVPTGRRVSTPAETFAAAEDVLHKAAWKVAACDDGCCLDPTLLRLAGEVLAADQATPLGDITDT